MEDNRTKGLNMAKTFNELARMSTDKKSATSPWWMVAEFLALSKKEQDTVWVLHAANRGYQTDNLNPNSEGNYLGDFLTAHGDEKCKSIYFSKGSPQSMGTGIIIEE